MDTTKKEVAPDFGGLTDQRIIEICDKNGLGPCLGLAVGRAIEREVLATRTSVDVGGLTRYDHRGCLMVPDPSGDYCNITDVRALLATKAAAEAAHPVEQGQQVSGLDYPTTYADLARITPTALFNRWLGSRSESSITPRGAFLAARAIPAPAEQPSTPVPRMGGNTFETFDHDEEFSGLIDAMAKALPKSEHDMANAYARCYVELVEYLDGKFLAHVARQPAAATAERAAVPEQEIGWCLERGPASAPHYLHVDGGMFDWTLHHMKAIRFARRADAEQVAEIVEDADRIAEHMWVAAPAAQEGEQGSVRAAPMFSERDPSKPAEQQGIFRKFEVRRVDGSDQPGGKHHGCRYFVLDLDHDQHAPAAMRRYAADCASTHPQLASDIAAEFGAHAAPADLRDAALSEAVKACGAERIVQQETYMPLAEGDVAYNLAVTHCVSAIRALRSTSAQPKGRAMRDGDQFYLQDSRDYVGNDVLWWAKGGNGYTTDLSKAQVYTKAEAVSQHESRETDIPWPKAYIDTKTRPAVDMQYIKRDEALAGTGIVLRKPPRRQPDTINCGGCGRFIGGTQRYLDNCSHCDADNRP